MPGGGKATAAPKKRARAKVIVLREDNDEPLRDATVEIWSQAKGKTDKKGVYLSPLFVEGTYDLKVGLAGFCPAGMNPRKEWTYVHSEEFPRITYKQPHKEITVKLAQALPRAKVTVVDTTRQNAGIPGVQVEITGQKMGRADTAGLYFSPPFKTGKYHVKARKPGYGPPGASPPREGEVAEWHEFNQIEDKAFTMKLAAFWNRVTSSKITVGGKHFVDWFNDDFRSRMPKNFPANPSKPAFPGTVNKGGFTNVFDNLAKLYRSELTVEEFIGIFLIIYNETGGSFAPISEKGTPKYMFEPKKGVKVSYNQGGNRKAGDLLKARGKISTDEEVAQWNGVVWPNPDEGSELYQEALECDFWKFRGRGLIQITWRSSYLKHVDPALTAAGKKKSDELTEAELGGIIQGNADVYLPMVRSFLTAVRGSYAEVNRYNWKEFAFAIGGRNAKAYAALYEWRAENLFTEMRKDTFELK